MVIIISLVLCFLCNLASFLANFSLIDYYRHTSSIAKMIPQGARGILAASIILPILAFIAVSLRIVARRKRAASLQSDDWTIIVTLVVHSCYLREGQAC